MRRILRLVAGRSPGKDGEVARQPASSREAGTATRVMPSLALVRGDSSRPRPACPSDLKLEAHLLGLSRAAALTHLQGCSRCGERLRRVERAGEHFLRLVYPATMEARVDEGTRPPLAAEAAARRDDRREGLRLLAPP
jgi:hypothetical protein